MFSKTVALSLMMAVVLMLCANANARTLIGEVGDARIRINTLDVGGNEYVNASDVLEYFPNQWRYDGLSGTLIVYRADGTRVSMQADDPRILIGQQIEQTGITPLRENGRFLIPFYIVYTTLFPDVSFQEEEFFIASTPTPTEAAVDPNRFLFRTPTPLPEAARPFVVEPFRRPTATPVFAPAPEPERVEKTVIVIDPGNDRNHPGAIARNGVREHIITQAISQQLAANLEQESEFEVVLTHRGNSSVALSNMERIAIANREGASLFISIHCGEFFTDSTSRGGVYFMNDRLDTDPEYGLIFRSVNANPPLWHDAYKPRVTSSLTIAQRTLETLRTVYQDAGVITLDTDPRPGRFAILRGLTMPGILIELGNLADPKTASYLSTEYIQQELANELTIVILNYLYEQSVQTSEGRQF